MQTFGRLRSHGRRKKRLRDKMLCGDTGESEAMIPKPNSKKDRRRKKRLRDKVRSELRLKVLAADRGCVNPECPGFEKTGSDPLGRPYLHTAHIIGRGRGGGDDPSESMCLCWWCHDAVDGRHHELWPELTPDERKSYILDHWVGTRHYEQRGWAQSHKQLKAKAAA